MGKFIDLTGRKIGKWNVIQRVNKKKSVTHWLCICECGIHSFVSASHLVGGKSTKCKTCHNKEAVKKRPMLHGHAMNKRSSREYSCWTSMRNRCKNPNDEHWKNYGERGIKVCAEWDDFIVFLNDMGKRPKNHTLDRIDVNGDYSLRNCRWATQKEQCENKRTNKYLEMNDLRKTKSQWARDMKIPLTTFSRMIDKYGWPLPAHYKEAK